MSRLTLLRLGIVVVVCGAYGFNQLWLQPRSMTLKMVQQTCRSPKQLTRFQILRVQAWARGALVLYRAICQSNRPDEPNVELNGYEQLTRKGLDWPTGNGGSVGYSPPNPGPSSSQLIELLGYSSGRISGNIYPYNDPYAFVAGRILDAKVDSVEARFNDGRILQDDGRGGVFAFVPMGAIHLCELQVKDATGQVLKTQMISKC